MTETDLTTEMKYLRSYETLDEDCVSPATGSIESPKDQRHAAIIEVLRRLPEIAYQALVGQIDSFHWFIPNYQSYGKVEPVFATVEFEIIPGSPVKLN